jgi:hypothetical protein
VLHFPVQPSARRVDSSDLVFSLSSHRHSYIDLIFNSRFIDSWYTNKHSVRSFLYSLRRLRHVTGLWTRPVIQYRSVSVTYRWTTSPAWAGTGEPLHRLEPVPVRGSFPPFCRFIKWQEYRSHRTKSVGLYHPTQRTHIQLNMNSKVRVSQTSVCVFHLCILSLSVLL